MKTKKKPKKGSRSPQNSPKDPTRKLCALPTNKYPIEESYPSLYDETFISQRRYARARVAVPRSPFLSSVTIAVHCLKRALRTKVPGGSHLIS